MRTLVVVTFIGFISIFVFRGRLRRVYTVYFASLVNIKRIMAA